MCSEKAASRFKQLKHSYGFDEVAIVPGDVTLNPDQTNIDFQIGDFTFGIPIIAADMDAVTDVPTVIKMSQLGGLAVLNLDGVQARYDKPAEILQKIARATDAEVTALLQKIYREPVKENLVGERVQAIKKAGAVCAVSLIPANAKRLAPVAAGAGADILVVKSTVTSARHISKSYRGLIFSELCEQTKMPIIVGNCVSYNACLELMRTGISGVLVGVGPGAACTSREVLGLGVPQITATIDCAAARDEYYRESGRNVPIITDGGFRKGGDVCKAFAAGADAVMLGSNFSQVEGAPGGGYHWGMSHPHPSLPRGTRIKVGTTTTLERLLFGPTSLTHGTENLVGALRMAMGFCGAADITEFHRAEMVIAPAITTEGKSWQMAQGH
ncbi:MAG TPA: GuaB3 family IMP dehydrogenase-related protein [Dehalococcoidales bacterium]|nr:GuaB3 family IMP dehydrogenase-related protein [Dehalococcoidales bacterium]